MTFWSRRIIGKNVKENRVVIDSKMSARGRYSQPFQRKKKNGMTADRTMPNSAIG